MAKIVKNNLENFLIILLIFSVVGVWVFSGWPKAQAQTIIDVLPNTKHVNDGTNDTLNGVTGDDSTTEDPDTLSAVDTGDNVYTVDKNAVMQFDTFDISSIPDGSTISAVILHLQYGAENGYNGTNPVSYDNGSGLTTTGITPTDITGWSADLTFDLYTAGVDTKTEIQNVDIEFTSNDGAGPDAIHFDYVRLTVIYTPPIEPTFNQSAYRWFDNTDSTDVGTPLAVQDTAATLSSSGVAFHLRLLLHIDTAQLDLNGENFKLQFAERSGTCDAGFSGESYADVAAATIIAYNDNSPLDGAALTPNVNDPTHGGDTIVNQDYEEANNFTNTEGAIPAGQDGKWDFALIDNSAPANTTYCLRVVKSDNSTLDTYAVIPEITTAGVGRASGRTPEDNSISGVTVGETLRLRIEVVNQAGAAATDYSYRLEYASKNGSCGSFISVPSSIDFVDQHFVMTASGNVADGQDTTAWLDNAEGYNFTTGKIVADPSNSSAAITLPASDPTYYYTEIEFVFQATINTISGGTYCFRVTNTGTVLDEYSIYPELTMVP